MLRTSPRILDAVAEGPRPWLLGERTHVTAGTERALTCARDHYDAHRLNPCPPRDRCGPIPPTCRASWRFIFSARFSVILATASATVSVTWSVIYDALPSRSAHNFAEDGGHVQTALAGVVQRRKHFDQQGQQRRAHAVGLGLGGGGAEITSADTSPAAGFKIPLHHAQAVLAQDGGGPQTHPAALAAKPPGQRHRPRQNAAPPRRPPLSRQQ